MTEKALDDLRVLEIAQTWVGALAGRLLAELGAEVIKIEPPSGDPVRSQPPFKANKVSYNFQLAAANKKSIVLDLSSPKDRNNLSGLVRSADILLEDAGPGRMEKLGLGWASFSQGNPQLIYCSVTPFGQTGPLKDHIVSNLVLEAMSGHMAVTGQANDPPTKAGAPMANHVGAICAVIAVLAALAYRDRTGRGQYIDLSVHDSMVYFLTTRLPAYFLSGRAKPRYGNRHLVAPWNSYQAKDGMVVITTVTQGHWERLARTMGREDLISDPRFLNDESRFNNADALDALVNEWTETKTVQEIVQLMEEIHIPVGPIYSLDRVLEGEHLKARQMIVEVEDPVAGNIPTIGSVFKMSETPGSVERAAPSLGQDNSQVLSQPAPARQVPLPEEIRKRAGQAEKKILSEKEPSAMAGIRILDIGHGGAGPFGLRFLANLGAEVIKIEPPQGELIRNNPPYFAGDSYMLYLYNCDKKSLAVDLTRQAGVEIVLELGKKADVVLDNYAPGAMEKLGLGPKVLRETNSKLIYGSLTGFGLTGPYRTKPAFDTVIQGMAGGMSLTGWPDNVPTKTGMSMADMLGGSFAVATILAGLHYRHRTGRGQHLDIAMYDAYSWFTQSFWPDYFASGTVPTRIGNHHWRLCPHNSYSAKNGLMVLSVEEERQWKALCSAMGKKELASDHRYDSMAKRLERVDEIDDIVSHWAVNLTVEEAVAACQRAGVPSGPVFEVHEVFAHSQIQHRQMVVERECAPGQWAKITNSPLKMSETPGRVTTAGPKAGEHGPEILTQLLGYKRERVTHLLEEGIIAVRTTAAVQ